MTILKTIMTGNGIATAHKAVKAEIIGDAVKVQVHMYPSASEDTDANLLWQEYLAVPLSALDAADPWGSIEQALLQQDSNGLFSGGAYVPMVAAEDISLEALKARKWSEVKARRAQLESAGFDVPGVGRFDSDAESRSRIVGAVLAGKIAMDAGSAYDIDWTLADGSTAHLGAAAMIGVGASLLQHLDGIHQHARALHALIEAAADAAALAEIDWSRDSDEFCTLTDDDQ
jgi:hypothetical protein